MNSKTRGLHRLFLANHPIWALCVLIDKIGMKIKDKCTGFLLHAPGIHLGRGCIVRGSKNIRFGQGMYVHGHLWIEAIDSYRNQVFKPSIKIGHGVSFSEGVHISCIEEIHIGNGVLFGSHVYVSDHNHGRYKGLDQSHPEEPPSHRELGGGGPVDIGDFTWIGDNVVIVGPIKIGRGAVIGANSVVREAVPEYTMVVGAPAHIVKTFNVNTQQWEKQIR